MFLAERNSLCEADVNASKMCMCGERFVLFKQEPQKTLMVGVSGRRTVKRKTCKYTLRSLDLMENRKLQVWLAVCVYVCSCTFTCIFKT